MRDESFSGSSKVGLQLGTGVVAQQARSVPAANWPARVPSVRRLNVWLLSLLILLTSVGLRLWNLAAESASYDEISARFAAVREMGDYFRAPTLEYCPPVYYLILHPLSWVKAGIWLMRLPSVTAGALTCVLLYLIGRKLFQERAAAVAGLLLAVNPLHIYYSQEAEPAVLFTLVALLGFHYLIRSAETNRAKHWIWYDVCATVMLYLHRGAPFILAAYLLVHLAKSLFFPDREEQRKRRRGRLVVAIIYNYLVIVALALPWLFLVPNAFPWHVALPQGMDLVRVFTRYYSFGMLDPLPGYAPLVVVVLGILLLPPLLATLRELDFRVYAVIAALALGLLLPFGYSFVERARFIPVREAILCVGLFAWLLGVLVARRNFYVRGVLYLVFFSVFLLISVRQAKTLQKLPWNSITKAVQQEAKPGDLLAFWPDFTTPMGRYYFGERYQTVSATDLIEKWAELPKDQNVFVLVQQYPSRKPYLHTFPGALKQFAKSEILWKDRLNYVIRANSLDRAALRLWYENPASLNVVDSPSSETQFIFTADHEVFHSSQFHWQEPEFSYELESGRRIVWTSSARTDLQLNVMLAEGNYVLKLHCSPSFESPEYDGSLRREVQLEVRTGEQRRKLRLNSESSVQLPFSTETEVRSLSVHIEVDPVLRVPQAQSGPFGLKIYSISIDQAGGGEVQL